MDDPAASQSARERIIFSEPCISDLFCGKQVTTLSPCFVFYFTWVSYNTWSLHKRLFYTLSMIFSWRGGRVGGMLHIFQFLFWVGHRGCMGRLPSCVLVFISYRWTKLDLKLKAFFFFLVCLVLSPHLFCQEISFHFFYLLLNSCFYTLRPFDTKVWSR